MKISLLKMSFLFLTLTVVTSCGFNITDIHPNFLDPKRGYARKYEFYAVTPKRCGDAPFDVRQALDPNKKPIVIPVNQMDGYVCFSMDEAQTAYSKYLEDIYNKAKCTTDKVGGQ